MFLRVSIARPDWATMAQGLASLQGCCRPLHRAVVIGRPGAQSRGDLSVRLMKGRDLVVALNQENFSPVQ